MSVNERDAVFAALADEYRRLLLERLRRTNGQTLSRLCDGLPISRQAVTKHLQVLADAGLASDIREGRERLWQFEPRALATASKALDLIDQQWRKAILRAGSGR